MKVKKNSNKPYIYYFLFGLMIVLMLNTFLFPDLINQNVKEVDYGTFLEMVENGQVKSVEVREKQIGFSVSDENSEEVLYLTGRMDDPDLVNRLYKADVEFTQVIPKETSPIISFLLMWIIPLIIIIFLGQFFVQKMSKKIGGGQNVMTFGKSNARIYVEAATGKSFADVAGQDEAKEALQELIDFLHHPQKYKEMGAKIPKGVLLVGPPGTGKTLIAKAVAGEAKVPFFSISGSEFVEMFVGMGAARVRDLFKQAQEKAPCIVFIDEIDTIGKSRAAGGPIGNEEREQTLNQLLSEMDGFESDKGVIILAATNRPDILDKALLRPGRFDRRIPLELPDVAGREAILNVHARKAKMGEDVDLKEIAKATAGASGADLANIINEAALRAVKLNHGAITQEDLEAAIELAIAGYPRKNAVISKEERTTISYHEIGHAIVAAKLKNAAPVHKITIIPRTSGALGFTMQVEENEKVLMTKEQILDKITTLMGGRAAEELVFNTITSGAANDIEEATKMARAMVTRFGMSEEFGMMALETLNNPYLDGDATLVVSDETAAKIDEAVLKIIKQCYNRALHILTENTDKLHGLAAHLLEKETLSGEEFMNILLSEKN